MKDINLNDKYNSENEGWSDTYDILRTFFSEKNNNDERIIIIIIYLQLSFWCKIFKYGAEEKRRRASFHLKAEKKPSI